MENIIDDEMPIVPSITLTENTFQFLKVAANWSKFLAILGYILCGFMAFVGLIATLALAFVGNEMNMMPFPPILIGILYLLFAAVYFFPAYYIYNFSTKAQKAINTYCANQFEEAIKNLKSYFKFIGIFIIVMVALYIVLIIVMIAGFAFFQDGIMEWQQQSFIQ